MTDLVRNIAIGFSAAALLMAGSGLDTSRAAPSPRAIQLAQDNSSEGGSLSEAGSLSNSDEPRAAYETRMRGHIHRTTDTIRELRTHSTGVTADQLSTVESSFSAVERQWGETQQAADEDWNGARQTMDESWNEFHGIWEDTFGEPLDDSPM